MASPLVDADSNLSQPAVREGKLLIDATRPFAVESPVKSWAYLLSTLAILSGAVAVAAIRFPWPVRLASSVFAGLVLVRGFILFHDHMHGALLRNSRIARAIFNVYGLIVMTPPRVWRDSHNYHHAHTAKLVGSHVGSYPMVTVAMWQRMKPRQRLVYAAIRHPLNIAFGYFTVFIVGMCISPLIRDFRKNVSAALALLLHASLAFVLISRVGTDTFLFAYFIPLFIACGLGGYLFYAQHNFPDIIVQPRESWTYSRAALESSSYMEMGPLMRFFTGNIGYHHVHHLNPLVPFYRLPEAMASVPELQSPHKTSLHPRDIAACFRLKLWDTRTKSMVGFPSDEIGLKQFSEGSGR